MLIIGGWLTLQNPTITCTLRPFNLPYYIISSATSPPSLGVARGADDAMALAALLDDLLHEEEGERGGGGKKGKKDVSSGKGDKAKAKGTSSSSSVAPITTATAPSSSSGVSGSSGRLVTKPQPLSLVLSDAMLGGLDCLSCQDHVGVVLVADAAGQGSGLVETKYLQGGQRSAGCLVCHYL